MTVRIFPMKMLIFSGVAILRLYGEPPSQLVSNYCFIVKEQLSQQRLKKLGLYDMANYCTCLYIQTSEQLDVVA